MPRGQIYRHIFLVILCFLTHIFLVTVELTFSDEFPKEHKYQKPKYITV